MSKQKKKLLTNFDFSVEGAHVALVTRAANGKTEPLIVKKAPIEKMEDGEEDDKPSGVNIEMSLEDFLQHMLYMWPDTASLVANSIKKSAESDDAYASIVKALPQALVDGGGSNSDSPSSVRPAPVATEKSEATKPNTEDKKSMSQVDTTSEQGAGVQKAAETEALLKKVEDMQKRLEKFEADEEVRKSAKFGAMVVKYAAIGAKEEDADVLKSLSEQTGFDRVLAMLDSAVETMKNANLLEPEGVEGEQNALSTTDELTAIAKGLMEQDKTLTIQKALVKAAITNPHLTV